GHVAQGLNWQERRTKPTGRRCARIPRSRGNKDLERSNQRRSGNRKWRATGAERRLRYGERAGLAVDYHLPAMWTSGRRDDADECLSFLLRLSSVWCEIKAEGRTLLRLLQLRISAMPANSDRRCVLHIGFATDCALQFETVFLFLVIITLLR